MGGGGDTTSTVYQHTLPDFAEPYYKGVVADATAESKRPYQPYKGQRIADQTPQTTAAYNMAQNFAQSGTPDLANARSLSEMVGHQAMDLQNYVAGGVNNTYTGPQDWQAGAFGRTALGQDDIAKLVSQNFGAAERDQYMSPFMESVVQASQADAQQKALQEQALIRAQQGTSGAFGGSRGAMQTQMAMNDAQKRIADIGVQGRQSAFENAQQQFERDQARNFAAQQGNQGMAFDIYKQNEAAKAAEEQSRQFGYTAGEEGRQKASELGMQAQTSTEQLRQGGKQLGLQGLELAGNTAGQLANFQQMQDAMTLQRMQAELGVGQSIEDRQQKGLTMNYQDFLNQVNYPRESLGFRSSIIQGLPTATNQTQTQTTPNDPAGGFLGGIMGWQALNNLYGSSAGKTTR